MTDVAPQSPLPLPGAITYYMLSGAGLSHIPRDERILQEIVRELRSDPRFSEILEPFIFSNKVDPYPYSRLLNECMNNLSTLGELLTPDPLDEGKITINPMWRSGFLPSIEKESGEYLPTLQLLAQVFAEKITPHIQTPKLP